MGWRDRLADGWAQQPGFGGAVSDCCTAKLAISQPIRTACLAPPVCQVVAALCREFEIVCTTTSWKAFRFPRMLMEVWYCTGIIWWERACENLRSKVVFWNHHDSSSFSYLVPTLWLVIRQKTIVCWRRGCLAYSDKRYCTSVQPADYDYPVSQPFLAAYWAL